MEAHGAICSQGQVAQRAAAQIRKPALREMMWSVVHDVAALAKADEIAQLIVAGVRRDARPLARPALFACGMLPLGRAKGPGLLVHCATWRQTQ
jgi:hypothetical protein